MERVKQQASTSIFKILDPPTFQIHVTNGHLEKPSATATLKFDIGDRTHAANFVVMKNLMVPLSGLHFMRRNSVVIETTHGFIPFHNQTMRVKSTARKTSAKPQLFSSDDNLIILPFTTKLSTLVLITHQNGKQRIL